MKNKGPLAVLCGFLMICCMCALAYAESKPPLRLGAVLSLKGRNADLGEANKNTFLMVVEQVNKSGGINGFPVEIIIEDDMTLESGAKEAVKKLIETEKVLAILGPCISGNSLAVKGMCEAAKIPMVSSAAAEAIVEPAEESKFIFKTPPRDSHAVMRILEQIKDMGITKIAIISETTPFGKQGREQLIEHAPKIGIEIAVDQTFGPTATTMVPQLEKIKAGGVGAIVNWAVLPTQTIVPKEMKKMGMNLPLFHSHGFGSPKAIENCGAACDGIVFPQCRLPVTGLLPEGHFQKKLLSDYRQAYQKAFGKPATTFGGQAYDAIWLVLNAIKQKNVTPFIEVPKARLMIRDGIEQTTGWVGAGGVFNMSPTDHVGLDKDRSLDMLQIKAGKIVPAEISK